MTTKAKTDDRIAAVLFLMHHSIHSTAAHSCADAITELETELGDLAQLLGVELPADIRIEADDHSCDDECRSNGCEHDAAVAAHEDDDDDIVEAARLVDAREHYIIDPLHPAGGYHEANRCYRQLVPGDVVTFEVAAPGRGRVTYRVTTVDARGAWGVCIASSVRELTAGDVR